MKPILFIIQCFFFLPLSLSPQLTDTKYDKSSVPNEDALRSSHISNRLGGEAEIESSPQKAVFLHHSTGNGVWNGGVPQWIADYNSTHRTNYQVTEFSFPDTPYPWENYPYDYWNLWINENCDSDNRNIECLHTLTEKYDLIIIKHCFPGSAIKADTGNPDITSKNRSLENYKLQYRGLRELFDKYPATKFMVWTLAPLHRLSTNADDAARAGKFADWVKTEWLTEDGKSHSNIYIFDFFELAAETSRSPVKGEVNCLRYEYEKKHDDGDSHPNAKANTAIAPYFAKAIVDALADITQKRNSF